MGGSLGRALIAAGVEQVRGFDPDPSVGAQAVEVGAVTSAHASLAEAVAGAQIVVVGAPIGRIPQVLREVFAVTPPECVVTDLGSAKAAIVASVDEPERARFLGGHPICGGERSGVAAGRGDMFTGATWFLTPTPHLRPDLYQRVHAMVAAVGARPVAIDAAVHDELLALVSHVPHVLASALIEQGAHTTPGGREALRSAGPSFKDLTRVAGSNPPLWADIFLSNRQAVAVALADYRRRLAEVEEALHRGDRDALVAFVARAAEAREHLRRDWESGDTHPWRIVVGVPNQPGVLSEIVTALGHAHINIEDLSLLPSSERGGELWLVVHGEQAARQAAQQIESLGYGARLDGE